MAASRYRKLKINGRTVSTHRWVWEQTNGPIPANMIVHHIDGDRMNNDIGNLEILSHAEHSGRHNNKHPRVKTCEVCGEEFTPAPTKRERAKTCSRPCMCMLQRRIAISKDAANRFRR